jgi:glycosyltransferase involved in cell wall biosynthesis
MTAPFRATTGSVPAVSIGMPVFNGAQYIRQSVQSILNQDYTALEIIISDNASTDETEAICRELAGRDERIRYYRNEANVGAARNYNKVFHLANGKFFKWAAHDDECHHKMIGRCVEVLGRAPASVGMVYPLGELIDEQGKTLRSGMDRIGTSDPRPHRRLAHLLRSLNMCDPVFGLYRTEYLKKTQLIGPFCGADYVMLGELAMLGQIWEINEVLFRLRAHPKRSMQANASARARTAWYSPAAGKKLFILPDWEQMVCEMLKSACRSSLPVAEKLKCCAVILGVHYWGRFKDTGGQWKRKMWARFLGQRSPAATTDLAPRRS